MANLSTLLDGKNSNHSAGGPVVDQQVLDVWFAFNVILIVIAFLLFSLLFAALLLERKFHSSSGLLILHQVIAEGQMTTIHFSVFLVMIYKSQWSYYADDHFCHHYLFSYLITVTACQIGMAHLAVNRFVALCFPLAYRKWTGKWVLWGMVASCWVYGFVCYAPFYFGYAGGKLRLQ